MEIEKLNSLYLRNKEKIAQLIKRTEKKRDKAHITTNHLTYAIYWNKIRSLEKERDKKINDIEKELEEFEKNKDAKIDKLSEIITKVDRYIEFLKLSQTFQPVMAIRNNDVTRYDNNWDRDKYIEWLEYLHKDDFLKIRLLIAENDRPKNKYSLIVYGRCVFSNLSDTIIKMPYYYGVHLNDYSFSIRGEIRCFPSLDELNLWVEKNKTKILSEFMAQFGNVKKEYLEVTEKYELNDFKELVKKEGE